MERPNGVDRRYARALFQISRGNLETAKIRLESLAPLTELFAIESARRVLNSPVMPVELKQDLLAYATKQGGCDPTTERFVKSMVSGGRIANLPGFIKAFEDLILENQGVIYAEVITANEMTEQQMTQIEMAIGNGKSVDIKQKIDSDLIGGFIVRVRNQMVDLSLKTQLSQFAKNAIG